MNVDQWLARATDQLSIEPAPAQLDAIGRRIAAEGLPESTLARRNARGGMIGAAVAAVLVFSVAGGAATTLALPRTGPTWVAAPSAASPYGLLVGE